MELQPKMDNKTGKGIAILHLIVIVIFITFIITGFSLSNNISSNNSLSPENIKLLIKNSLKTNSDTHFIPLKQTVVNSASGNIRPSGSSREQKDSMLPMSSKAKAMLGMFVVMLKKG